MILTLGKLHTLIRQMAHRLIDCRKMCDLFFVTYFAIRLNATCSLILHRMLL